MLARHGVNQLHVRYESLTLFITLEQALITNLYLNIT